MPTHRRQQLFLNDVVKLTFTCGQKPIKMVLFTYCYFHVGSFVGNLSHKMTSTFNNYAIQCSNIKVECFELFITVAWKYWTNHWLIPLFLFKQFFITIFWSEWISTENLMRFSCNKIIQSTNSSQNVRVIPNDYKSMTFLKETAIESYVFHEFG